MKTAEEFVITLHPSMANYQQQSHVLDVKAYAGHVCAEIKLAKSKQEALAILNRVIEEGNKALEEQLAILADMEPTNPKRGKPERATKTRAKTRGA